MQLTLIDTNEKMVSSWKSKFKSIPEVNIHHGNITESAYCCVASPANSYGYMDGGVDQDYVNYFGIKIEKTVREIISCLPEKKLPIGVATLIKTEDIKIPYMIIAPTMEMPESTSTQAVFRATAAMLRKAEEYPTLITHLFCPGFGTGIGKIEPEDAAEAMFKAYQGWFKRKHS